MLPIATAHHFVDLLFLGRRERIGAGVVDVDDGYLLVDPGPSSTLPALEEALARTGRPVERLRAILLTHIHLDHAGCTGVLLARCPGVPVYVHERGAKHLADPSSLVASAQRLYGDAMERLWGAIRPVPAGQIRPLAGGERVTIGGKDFDTRATPGHAQHHLAWFDPAQRVVYVGDAVGERFPRTRAVIPVTPPPDIDVPAMVASAEAIRGWQPRWMVLTHFGAFDDPDRHIVEHNARLLVWAEQVRRDVVEERDPEVARAAFVKRTLAEYHRLEPGAPPGEPHPESMASSWTGLARYWRVGHRT